MAAVEEAENRQIAIWKTKEMFKHLETFRGIGTSLITLLIPSKHQTNQVQRMLVEELGTAANIRHPTNRYCVVGAIIVAQQQLKLYSEIPENGLVLFCGSIINDNGEEEHINIDFIPYKPINNSLFVCDYKFHVEHLTRLITDDELYGIIIIDGNGSLFATLQGTSREVLYNIAVDIPKKLYCGSQSATRFARNRTERQQRFIRKVCEIASGLYVTEQTVNVNGLIIAGSSDLKYKLAESHHLDPRLKSKIMTVLEIGYGGVRGLNDAISMASDVLDHVLLVEENKLIQKFFDTIGAGGNVFYGVANSMHALKLGAIETLIVWDGLLVQRIELKSSSGDTIVKYLFPKQKMDKSFLCDHNGDEMEILDQTPLLDWLVNNYKTFGPLLGVVSKKSNKGIQFACGFGGIGGMLRFSVDFSNVPEDNTDDLDDIEFNLEDYD